MNQHCGSLSEAGSVIMRLSRALAMTAWITGFGLMPVVCRAAEGPGRHSDSLPATQRIGDVQRGPDGRIVPRDPSQPHENWLGKGRTIRVGPKRRIRLPSEAARIARDGDIVEIDAGVYKGDVAVWRQNDLTLRGIGGRAHLEAAGKAAEDKAIWVIKSPRVVVENIEFSGASVHDRNGAGIKFEGVSLTVRGCYFHDNQDGLLTRASDDGEVTVERSEFARNGEGDGYSHNMYIGPIRRFTLRFSYSHEAHIGHEVKSRARENYILYNRLADGADGDASYVIDLSQGGTAYIVGNIIQKGRRAENAVAVSLAAEGPKYPSKGFYVVNNTFINERAGGTFVRNRDPAAVATLINNLVVGTEKALEGPGTTAHDLISAGGGFRNSAQRDYHLAAGSPAIGAGVRPPTVNGFDLMPDAEYADPLSSIVRNNGSRVDVGAYAFSRH